MRVLRLVYDWPPPWDGLAPGPYEISKAQLDQGHQLTVFAGGGELSWRNIFPQVPQMEAGIAVYRLPRVIRRFSLFLTTAPVALLNYLRLRLSGEKFDLVHGHGHITLCFSIYKLLFGFLDPTPFVLHFHITAAGREKKANERGSVLDFWTRCFEWPLHKLADQLGARVADKVICSSEQVTDEAKLFYGVPAGKLTVVENGVNSELFSSEGDNLRDELGLFDSKVLFYNGALSKRKNVDLIIYALRLLASDFKLLIVGRGEPEYEDYLKKLVREKKLENRVKFCGYVEYEKLPPYFRTADLFVIPSAYEGLPKVVLQSLSCGVPVLASGFGMKERPPGLNFLAELDPEALADSVREIFGRTEKVDTDLMRRKYDWSVKVREIEKVYEEIAAVPGGKKSRRMLLGHPTVARLSSCGENSR